MNSTKSSTKSHAVFIPFPLQGHITPMMQLAKLFHHKGFYVTFINAGFIHNRLTKNPNNLRYFDFETFNDGLPAEYSAATKDLLNICHRNRNNFLAPLQKVVSLINLRNEIPPVTCVISDMQMPFTIKIAKEIGVPCILFWTASMCSLSVYKHYYHLMERGVLPIKDENSDKVIDCVPGLENIRAKDLPFGQVTFDFPMKELEEAVEASGIIVNSFETLEENILNAISKIFPKVYTIGPLQMLLNSTLNSESKSVKSNLWEEQLECLEWLDSMEPESVVYISFGSILDLTFEMVSEFAQGILNSNFNFMWVMKSNPINDEELLTKLKTKGFITNWCPQEKVLNHPAIGGFITHGGWNSILDSICAGVPIICCPFWADQLVNSRYSYMNWGIGINMNNVFKKNEVEQIVRELMVGEQGLKMRKRIIDLKKLATEAVKDDGSSSLSLEKLLSDASNYFDENISMEEKLQALVSQVIKATV